MISYFFLCPLYLFISFCFVLNSRVWRIYGEGVNCGDEAAEWISNFLNKPGYKMYKLSKPRVICEDDKWGDVALPDDKVNVIKQKG